MKETLKKTWSWVKEHKMVLVVAAVAVALAVSMTVC